MEEKKKPFFTRNEVAKQGEIPNGDSLKMSARDALIRIGVLVGKKLNGGGLTEEEQLELSSLQAQAHLFNDILTNPPKGS